MNRRRIILAALLLSVAVNLFFIGGLGMRMLRMEEFRAARPLPPNLGWIVRDLSESRRAELSDSIRTGAEQINPLRADIFAAQRRVNELMVAEEFDPEALAQAFAELRAASDRYQQATQEQTVAIFGELTHQERQSAREFVRRRGPRDGSPGPDGSRPPGPDFERQDAPQ
ncbi:MAG: periplasmic heavy metal sensor [Pseudomonadales bacterium]|nr:periplasmic heavy metal sensor [Pseudomonadales bacterium]